MSKLVELLTYKNVYLSPDGRRDWPISWPPA